MMMTWKVVVGQRMFVDDNDLNSEVENFGVDLESIWR